LDKRHLFKEGAIALEALSETTNGDADSVVMNPACQLPSSLRLSLTRILPMKRAFWRAPVSRVGSNFHQGRNGGFSRKQNCCKLLQVYVYFIYWLYLIKP
jgi:hypothetical protein